MDNFQYNGKQELTPAVIVDLAYNRAFLFKWLDARLREIAKPYDLMHKWKLEVKLIAKVAKEKKPLKDEFAYAWKKITGNFTQQVEKTVEHINELHGPLWQVIESLGKQELTNVPVYLQLVALYFHVFFEQQGKIKEWLAAVQES